MNKEGPIVIINDDKDDHELLQIIFKELGTKNEIKYFSTGAEALAYISKPDVKPFIILSDINLPQTNGFELREKVHKNRILNSKCIPYIIFTTGTTGEIVEQAYSLSVQGIFQKPLNLKEWKEIIKEIIDYWGHCISQNRN